MTAARRVWTVYDIAWELVTGSVIAVGSVAMLRMSAVSMLAIVVIATVFASVYWILRDFEFDFDLRRAVWLGIRCGAVAAASIGLIQLLGPAGLGIISVLVVASPIVLGRVARRLGLHLPVRDRAPAVMSTPVPMTDIAVANLSACDLPIPDHLSDDDLCLAWRSSFVALSRATSIESRLHIAEVRSMILDEFDRRDGVGLRCWLASGARAASDPGRHLTEPRR